MIAYFHIFCSIIHENLKNQYIKIIKAKLGK